MYAMYLRKSRSDNIDEDIEDTLRKHEKILFELADTLKIPKNQIMQFKEVVSGENIQNRPEMQKLLDYVMQGVFEGVLVVDSQRLARGDTLDQGTIIRAFSLNNTKIITPMKTVDPKNEYDQEYFEFDLFMGRREYKMITRRMQRGRHIAVQEGYYLGSIAPYGYNKVKLEKGYSLEIKDIEAKIVKIIFDMYLQGNGTTNIAKYLNSINIKPRKADRWTMATVRDILTNNVYCGLIKWNSRKTIKIYQEGNIVPSRPRNQQIEVYQGKHPPLVSAEQFESVQSSMKAKGVSKIPKDRTMKNPLSGLIICQKCGRKMVRRPYDNGRQETLICVTPGCDNVSSDLNIVENKIIEALQKNLHSYKRFIQNYDEQSISYQNDKEKIISDCDIELEKLKEQMDKACEMLEIGAYTVDLFKDRQTTINDKITSLIKQKELMKKETKEQKAIQYNKMIPNIEQALAIYHEGDIKEKNTILKSLIKECMYEKNVGGRWNPDAIDNFKLVIFFKNQ